MAATSLPKPSWPKGLVEAPGIGTFSIRGITDQHGEPAGVCIHVQIEGADVPERAYMPFALIVSKEGKLAWVLKDVDGIDVWDGLDGEVIAYGLELANSMSKRHGLAFMLAAFAALKREIELNEVGNDMSAKVRLHRARRADKAASAWVMGDRKEGQTLEDAINEALAAPPSFLS